MKKLKNVFTLYKLDWRRIFRNPIATLLIIALMIIPSLYAWFNIKALWDPYSNTGDLPIAVYSDDQAATFRDTKITIGQEVIKNLHDNDQLGWQFVDSKKELDNGVKSGKYFAGIYLPKDFSKDLLSFTTGDIQKPKIEYSVNEKINAIAPKITEKGASSLQQTITDEFTKTASSTLMTVFNELGYDLDANLLSINKVKDMILTTDENMATIDGYTKEITDLHAKMPELKEKVAKANEFMDYLPEVDKMGTKLVELNGKLPELKEQASVILTLQEKIPEIENAGRQLQMIDEDFASVEATMNDGIDVAKNALTIIQQTQQVLPEIEELGQHADTAITLTSDGVKQVQGSLPQVAATITTSLQLVQDFSTSIAGISSQWADILESNQLTPEQKVQLKDLLGKLIAGLDKQREIVSNLIATLEQLQQTSNDTSLQGLIDGLHRIDTALGTARNAANVLLAGMDTMTDQQIISALRNVSDLANIVSATINNVFQNNTIATVSDRLDAIMTELTAALDKGHGLLAQAQAIDFAGLLAKTETTVTNAIALLEKYQAEMPAIGQEIHDANLLLNGHMDTIVAAINKGADLYQNDLPTVEQKLGQAADFVQNDWPGIRDDLKTTMNTVNTKMPEVETALNAANDLIINDWPNIKSGIHKAADAIRAGEQDVDLGELIKLLKLDANKESDFLEAPVEVKEHALYPIPNYGSASTPFYTALCLWVGAVLFSSIATTDFHLDKKDKRYTKRETFAARGLTFLTMGICQALIVSLGNIFLLKVYVADPFWSVVFAVMIALAFMMIVYVLVAMFGNVGKGLAIIILVLSISGGGGNFPIQLSGKFFQMINPFLPFTHAVNLLREATGGIYWANADYYIVILISLFFVFAVIGLAGYPFASEKMKKLADKSHKSHIFH